MLCAVNNNNNNNNYYYYYYYKYINCVSEFCCKSKAAEFVPYSIMKLTILILSAVDVYAMEIMNYHATLFHCVRPIKTFL